MDVLSKHLPAEAVRYCLRLQEEYGFTSKVVKTRKTRLGDFRSFPTGHTQITVNADLNPYAFLITYIHEVAHAAVFKASPLKQRRMVRPHGRIWQNAFQQLMSPLLNEAVFPAVILDPLREYMRKPAASTYACPPLMKALREKDSCTIKQELAGTAVLLSDLSEGQLFRFQQKTYLRGTLRRTRVVCKEVSSAKSYAILAHAWVEKL